MKQVELKSNWPESWKYSYAYDLMEVYNGHTYLGYAYSYQTRHRHTLEMLCEVLMPGAKILDIAAAQGNFSLALAELGYDVTWNDLRSELVNYVRAKYEKGKISFAPGNAFELQFPHLFDAVLITEVIEHVAHPDDFLKNTARLVRPGGYIIMTTPNGAYFRNDLPRFSDCPDPSIFESVQFGPDSDDHIFLLHQDEVINLAQAIGLKIDQFVLLNNPLTQGHIKLGKLLKVLPQGIVNFLEAASQRMPLSIASKVHSSMAVRFLVPEQISL